MQNYSPRTPLHRRHYCLHAQVLVPEPTPLEKLDIQEPEDILGADRGAKNHLAVSSGHRAHHQGGTGRRKRKHQCHIAGKPRNSKRRRHAVAKDRASARRYTQRRDQGMRKQMREILLDDQPKLVAVESLKCISLLASARGTAAAPGKNVAAKRKLNESLAEAAIGHVGKLLHEEAAKLGIPTVSVPPQGTSQTCPRCGDRRPDNRESQAVFRCRNCGLYAHADWTAAVIIRNRAFVRHCEWQSGHTPDVLAAPTGWRQQPSRSLPCQPRLGLELSVFKPEGTATSSHGSRVRGPRPDHRIPAAIPDAQSVTKCEPDGALSATSSEVDGSPFSGHRTQFVNTLYAIPNPSDDHIEELRKRTVTARLEQAIGSALQFEERTSHLDTPGIKLGGNLVHKWMEQETHVLTANYDTLVENLAGMLNNAEVAALYPITVVPSPAIGGHNPHGTICISPALKLYKLHGSVSWYKSSDESNSGPIYGHCDFTRIDAGYQKRVGDKRRFIVPPLPDKSALLNHESIRNLWWQAKHHALAPADNLCVIGYSLPETDVAMRTLLWESRRPAQPGEPLRKIPLYVVNTDHRLYKHYDDLLGDYYEVRDTYLGSDAFERFANDYAGD